LVTHPELPAPMLAPLIETQVDDDAVEPGRELRAAVEAPRRLEDPDEGLLRQVARVLGVSHDGPCEPVRASLLARDEGVKRRLVAGLAILVELPPVLPEVAPVLADVPRVLSDVLAISTNVSPVLRHVPVRSELTAVLAEIAPVLLDIPHVLAQVPAVLTDVL